MAEQERHRPIKRYRKEIEKESDDEWNVSDEESNSSKYVQYVPIKERRKQNLVKLGRITEILAEDTAKQPNIIGTGTDSGASSATEENDDVSNLNSRNVGDEASKLELVRKEEEILAKSKDKSLLLQHSELKKIAEARQESELDKQLKEEEKILRSVAENTALKSAAELAKGIEYVDPIKTSWKPPSRILAKGKLRHDKVRKKHNILIEGEDSPPPLTTISPPPLTSINTGIHPRIRIRADLTSLTREDSLSSNDSYHIRRRTRDYEEDHYSAVSVHDNPRDLRSNIRDEINRPVGNPRKRFLSKYLHNDISVAINTKTYNVISIK